MALTVGAAGPAPAAQPWIPDALPLDEFRAILRELGAEEVPDRQLRGFAKCYVEKIAALPPDSVGRGEMAMVMGECARAAHIDFAKGKQRFRARPELVTWPVRCTLEGFSLVAFSPGMTLAVERASQVYVKLATVEPKYREESFLLQMPGCERMPLYRTPAGGGAAFMSAAPGGLRANLALGVGTEELTLISPEKAWKVPAPIEPLRLFPKFVLSDDGRAVLWLGRNTAVVTNLMGKELDRISLTADAYSAYAASFHFGRKEIVWATRQPNRIVVRDLKGGVKAGPIETGQVAPSVGNTVFLIDATGSQWAGWNRPGTDDPELVAWRLVSGSGQYRAERGHLKEVAFHPEGTYVAISIEAPDKSGVLLVLRTSDRAEVLRMYNEPFHHPHFQFVGTRFFAHEVVRTAERRISTSLTVREIAPGEAH